MNDALLTDYSYFNDVAVDGSDDDMFHIEDATSAADVVSVASLFAEAVPDNGTTVLKQFSYWYQGVHGYVSVACCLFGIVSNAMNILVLTRKSMVSRPAPRWLICLFNEPINTYL